MKFFIIFWTIFLSLLLELSFCDDCAKYRINEVRYPGQFFAGLEIGYRYQGQLEKLVDDSTKLFLNVLNHVNNKDYHKAIETFYQESYNFIYVLNVVFYDYILKPYIEAILIPRLESPITKIYAELENNMDKIFANPEAPQKSWFTLLYEASAEAKGLLYRFSELALADPFPTRRTDINHECLFSSALNKVYKAMTSSDTNNLLSKAQNDTLLQIFVIIHLWTSAQILSFFKVYCEHSLSILFVRYEIEFGPKLRSSVYYTEQMLTCVKESELILDITFSASRLLEFVKAYMIKYPNDDHREHAEKIMGGLSNKYPSRNWFVSSFNLSNTNCTIGLAQQSVITSILVEHKESRRSVLVATTSKVFDNSCFQIRDSYEKCLVQTKSEERYSGGVLEPRRRARNYHERTTICETVVNEIKSCTQNYSIIACFPKKVELGISTNIDEHEQSIERVKCRRGRKGFAPDQYDLNSGGPGEIFRLIWVQ